MPVYIYSDRARLNCIGMLDDDGRYYDRKLSILDSSPTMNYYLGSVDSQGRVYSDPQMRSQVGSVDSYGKIYRGWDILFSTPSCAPEGCVEGSEIYKGPNTWSAPFAYMDGYGNMNGAAAAAILLGTGSGSSSSYEDEPYVPDEETSYSSSYSGSYSSGGGGGGAVDPEFKGLKGCLIALVVIGLILYLAFGDEWREKEEKHEAWKQEQSEAAREARLKYKEEQKNATVEGWFSVDDTHGYYRTKFLNEGANDTFTFTYYVGNDSKVSFEIERQSGDLKTSAYIIYGGNEYNIYYDVPAKAGDQIVVVVEQRSGTGYYDIETHEKI